MVSLPSIDTLFFYLDFYQVNADLFFGKELAKQHSVPFYRRHRLTWAIGVCAVFALTIFGATSPLWIPKKEIAR